MLKTLSVVIFALVYFLFPSVSSAALLCLVVLLLCRCCLCFPSFCFFLAALLSVLYSLSLLVLPRFRSVLYLFPMLPCACCLGLYSLLRFSVRSVRSYPSSLSLLLNTLYNICSTSFQFKRSKPQPIFGIAILSPPIKWSRI